MFTIGPIFWSLCAGVAVVSAGLSIRSRRATLVGRFAVGLLMLVGGAAFNAVQLATGNDYSGFADPAHFRWVTDAWEAVVPPNYALLIGLLVLFEATVGILVLSGGRWTRLGYLAAIAFHAALWLFGWIETVYVLVMLPALVLLLLAERRPEPAVRPGAPERRPPRDAGAPSGTGARV
jgi:hypothetical protein